MVHITAPAVIAICVIGYLGINSIAQWITGAIKKKDEQEKR